ncbi:NADPH:quinone oxidoreductase family protein [Mycobacterium paragordonae]|uniref:NADPH:quinone oxidoreductase family protein n=1 Tax=Mycobacterium paragordonae TaxID=1389713 RepID=A0A4R5WYQ5_9MYCO|nr:NADPH:quinone oxidoreductase family protein [Mycobacterium paragordonae]MDP7735819.1 NADPH:quinone oxidoreductase family protein [Mycobacterium paragordonae]TDL01278.1 NADPH:quinone oxidoreductase family protein [Mycobacterium paragordonae]TDL10798.1 NADPH:quinone oxidoreductase family protein [Mycobacterium paragordonae]
MRAVQVVEESGPEEVVLADVPEPDGDLVVQVRAAGVSFPDLLMTQGKYQVRQQLPFTLGWEAAGDVVKAPPGGEFSVGDRVMTLTFGAHAERVAAVAETTFRLPDALDYRQGAALPLNYLTALAAVQRRGALPPGETVLVHGAAGGVGSACIQVAKALGGQVIGCVSTDEKARAAEDLGADVVLVGENWHAQLETPVAMIVDPVGGENRFRHSLRSLLPEGRIVVVGFAGGEIPTVSVNRLLMRNVDVRGCSFGVLAVDPAVRGEALALLEDLAGNGAISPLIGTVYPLDDIGLALSDLAARRAVGKVIVDMN